MKNKTIYKDTYISIVGMGIVIYSNEAFKDIKDGSDFFKNEFETPEQVARHIKKGDIIGFNLGSSGNYKLHFRDGYPSEDMIEKYPLSIRLALDVKGNKVSFMDLYWLMEWSDEVPEEQVIDIKEVIYHITVLTSNSKKGAIGDEQDVYIYFKEIDEMPKLCWNGVPCLF